MATITKREGKNGTSYLIRSSVGYDSAGKQIIRSMTWKPDPKWSEARAKKELDRAAILFDEECSAQGIGYGNVKFETFARQWIEEYAVPNLRPRTVYRLHQMEERTYAALGHIRRTSLYLSDRGVYTDTTKTAQSTRTLKLPAAVFDVLRQLRAEQAEERLKLGDLWHDNDRLFTNQDGKPMHPNTPYHWLKRFCESTGQRFLGIHAFRHLNASLLIDAGADVTLVSKSLGHSQVSTTLNIYSHSFAVAQAKASEAVADLLTIGKKA